MNPSLRSRIDRLERAAQEDQRARTQKAMSEAKDLAEAERREARIRKFVELLTAPEPSNG